jgi:fermentation-respiration switch protein FrsA (DUF1100 family)
MGWFAWGGVLIALYVGFVALLYFAQRSMIYLPDRSPVGAVQGFERVALQSADGIALVSLFAPPQGSKPVVAIFHGNAGHIGHRVDKARGLMARGYGVMLVGYRGYGGNPGSPSEDGLYADARTALDWLAGRGFVEGRLVIYGESLGSGVAVQMASERKALALVLEAPFTSLGDGAASHYPYVPARLLVKDKFANLAKIGAIATPLLIVHGERDRVLPVTMGRALLEKATSPKRGVFLPEAGHNDLMSFGLIQIVADHLDGLSAPR